MSDFKKGQKVWSFTSGWGIVTKTDRGYEDDSYPVEVEFPEHGDSYSLCYTKDGCFSTDESRSLFFKEIPIPEDALIPPVDEIVLHQGDIVLFHGGMLGVVAKFSGFEEKAFAWHNGVPLNLDDAYDTSSSLKKHIKKVVGSVNV